MFAYTHYIRITIVNVGIWVHSLDDVNGSIYTIVLYLIFILLANIKQMSKYMPTYQPRIYIYEDGTMMKKKRREEKKNNNNK